MSNLPKVLKKSVPDILRELGLLKEDILATLVERQKQSGAPYHRVLQELGLLGEGDLALVVCKQLGLPYVNAAAYQVSADVVGLFDIPTMMRHQFVALDKIGKALLVAVAGPPPPEVVDLIERQSGSAAFFCVAAPSQIEAVISRHVMTDPAKPASAAK